jgi:hypothetical protein
MSRGWPKAAWRCSVVVLADSCRERDRSGNGGECHPYEGWRRNITATDWKKAGAPGYAAYAGLYRIVVKRSGEVGVPTRRLLR